MSTVNLHQEQSVDTPVLTKIPKGAEVKVIDSRFGNWWMVEYGTQTGFTQSNYLKYSKSHNELSSYPIVALSDLYKSKAFFTLRGDLDLHEYDTSTSAVLTKLPKGVKVKVIQSGYANWCLIHYKGRTGYLQKQYLAETPPPEPQKEVVQNAYSLTKATSLRVAPDSQSKVLLRFKPGDQVTVLDHSGEWWWKASINGKRGWVKRRLLKKD